MPLPPKISISSCKPINDLLLKCLAPFNVNFFSYSKLYPNNKRFVLSSDEAFIKLYFDSKYYEVDWLGYEPALELFAHRIVTWQYCHEEHVVCDIWKKHQAIHATNIYFMLHSTFSNYKECYVFGIKADLINLAQDSDKELFFFINNKNLLTRFIQYFKGELGDIILQAEHEKFTAVQNQAEIQKNEHFSYWGEFIDRNDKFLDIAKPEKIYLQDELHDVYLTVAEAKMVRDIYYGATQKDIAKSLGLSSRTIEARFSEVKHKLNVKSKLELMELIAKYKIMDLIENSI